MINHDLILRFGAALLIGILIGTHREYTHGNSTEKGLFAGARMFALMSLYGTSAAFLADLLKSPWVFLGLVILLGTAIIIAYFISATEREAIGLTSELVALITILIGGICYCHSVEFAAALGVATTVLLAVKWEFRRFVNVITQEDVYATLQFAVITAIILPVLPNQTFGPPPLEILNPYQIWKMVVFISGINFLGYVLVKVVGPKKGLGISGLLGGLASSTATTMSFSQRSKTQVGLEKPFAVAIISGWVIMFIRVIVEVAVVNNRLLPHIWPTMAAMGLAGLIYALFLFFSQSAIDEEELSLSNPFELGTAIKFGLIYALVLLIIKAAEIYIGVGGIYVTSFIAGLADVDAITLSISDLTRLGGSIPLNTGKIAVIIAILSNTISKGVLVFSLGSKSLRK
ncbi:MAG: MgtC/SapB family protein, partial [Anaerolineales bacterium]|nr:MgtC/SapB family protein [Anaerolineales bacterium]